MTKTKSKMPAKINTAPETLFVFLQLALSCSTERQAILCIYYD